MISEKKLLFVGSSGSSNTKNKKQNLFNIKFQIGCASALANFSFCLSSGPLPLHRQETACEICQHLYPFTRS